MIRRLSFRLKCISDNRCDPIQVVAFSTPNSTLAYAGSVVEYRCQSGYSRLAGAKSTTICDGIQWNGVVSDCVRKLDRRSYLRKSPNILTLYCTLLYFKTY